MNDNLQPIPLEQPLPHRKTLRQWLLPLSQRSTLRALVLLLIDTALFTALITGTVVVESVWGKLLCGLAAGFVIGRMFIIGHDACHQSLTPHRGLNKWLGRFAFLTSLTPYSLWDTGHNVVHHGYTNLKGVDFVWTPLTAQEFADLSAGQRFLQYLYRSGWAPGLYYMIEIWWKREFFPNKEHMPTRRPIFFKDSLLVTVFGAVWVGVMAYAAVATGQSVALTLLWGVLVPFFFWNSMIGFVVYVHHTHVRVSWHNDKRAWTQAQPFVSTTVHLTFPMRIGALVHHIMEHTAHHVDMSIPLYRLKKAQSKLEEMLPGRIIVQPFSWRWYFSTAKACKLYDFSRECWTDFQGHMTSPVRGNLTPHA
ncbi:MAG: fatty acid desaturase [Limnohabitans sp.]|jgi:omega-6 fatty acid desaturase (delta-12 desaturase)|nr:fatty acid desaturase [Burkholderiales bacterium]